MQSIPHRKQPASKKLVTDGTATYTCAMRGKPESNDPVSQHEILGMQRKSHILMAFLQALLITIVLLLITFTLYQGWRERLVEKGRQAGRTELLGIRKNLFLLMGNQEMFTALFGQRLEESLAAGFDVSLAEVSSYLDYLEQIHPSFAFAAIARENVVVDTYPKQGLHEVGFDLRTLAQYEDHIGYTLQVQQVTLDGPLDAGGDTSYLVSRYALHDNNGVWGLLTLHFNFRQILLEAGVEDVREGYTLFFTFVHGSDEQHFDWGEAATTKEEAVVMDLSYSLLQWRMQIAPQGSWIEFSIPLLLYGVISSLVCISLGVMIYLNQIKFQMIKTRSRTDSLTGLLNRREFEKLLHQTCKEEQAFAVALIDIDNFKEINDTYGHLNGDKALLSLVESLKKHIRMSDGIARFGGDEFIILFHDCTNAEFCRRLFQAIRHTRVELEGIQVEVVISMGVALSEEGKQVDALIETADRRLYRAKLEGKGRICTTG